MPIEGRKLTVESRYAGPCPACGCRWVIRKTQDANSPYLGLVVCEDGCSYEATFDEFRQTIAKAKRLADI
jgi:hypothetical protein